MTMCVLCFNSQWRSVVIGTVSSVFCLLLLFITIGAKDVILQHCRQKLEERDCIQKSVRQIGDDDATDSSVTTYSLSGMSRDNSDCVYLVFEALFPWPLWVVLGLYFLLNANLVISAVYK